VNHPVVTGAIAHLQQICDCEELIIPAQDLSRKLKNACVHIGCTWHLDAL
jgi:hypothetical protein